MTTSTPHYCFHDVNQFPTSGRVMRIVPQSKACWSLGKCEYQFRIERQLPCKKGEWEVTNHPPLQFATLATTEDIRLGSGGYGARRALLDDRRVNRINNINQRGGIRVNHSYLGRRPSLLRCRKLGSESLRHERPLDVANPPTTTLPPPPPTITTLLTFSGKTLNHPEKLRIQLSRSQASRQPPAKTSNNLGLRRHTRRLRTSPRPATTQVTHYSGLRTTFMKVSNVTLRVYMTPRGPRTTRSLAVPCGLLRSRIQDGGDDYAVQRGGDEWPAEDSRLQHHLEAAVGTVHGRLKKIIIVLFLSRSLTPCGPPRRPEITSLSEFNGDVYTTLVPSPPPRYHNSIIFSTTIDWTILYLIWGRGGRVFRLLASHQGKPGSIPGRVTPGFLQVGIVPNDTAGRRVFSGISRFPRRCITELLHAHLISPSSALNISLLRVAQISQLNHIITMSGQPASPPPTDTCSPVKRELSSRVNKRVARTPSAAAWSAGRTVRLLGVSQSLAQGKPMKVIEVSAEQRRNERAGETGDSRENPPTNGHRPARFPHAKIRSDPTGD
ncbi:hypothetical protein PR048_021064 [Dryococelus australis]|uniref:Uncharacterized protein n=1 Tax=Dryococelus australis TaxID=614101 RepID=A0ABQ9GX67_9NEOP|nr:hypothetical protein PR048_021064 [Dryococelus australis]